MTESEIQKQIIHYLKLKGCIVMRLNSGRAAHNVRLCPPGTPDLLAIYRGGSVWIEVKTEKGKLRPEQENMHKELIEMGHRVIVARGVADLNKSELFCK